MWKYLAIAASYGLAKSLALGARSDSFPLVSNVGTVLQEEAVYRLGLERGLGRTLLGLDPSVARIGAAAAFGIIEHPWNPVESALGGVFYSYAYDKGGYPLAAAAHLLHNFGVYLGGLK